MKCRREREALLLFGRKSHFSYVLLSTRKLLHIPVFSSDMSQLGLRQLYFFHTQKNNSCACSSFNVKIPSSSDKKATVQH